MAKKKKSLHYIEYIDGNTARVLNPIPEHSWEDGQEALPRKKPQIHKKKKKKAAVAPVMDFGMFVFCTGAIIVLLYICVGYLRVRSGITKMSKDIARLESTFLTKETENNEALEKINASIDLDYIYKVATEELGMVHATQDQIITYESTKDDYVKQYGDIPDVEEKGILSKILPNK